MQLIIGLGNPGTKYQNSRHNFGFRLVDELAKRAGAEFVFEKKFNALVAKITLDQTDIILAKPATSMNISGKSVQTLYKFYDIQLGSLVVAHDDLDIMFGTFKISFDKDPAGHHGVESIIEHIHTKAFWRARLGIADNELSDARKITSLDQRRAQIERFVLSPFHTDEEAQIAPIISGAITHLKENVI